MSGRARGAATAVLGAGVAAVLVARPLAHGAGPAALLGFWAAALGLAVVPGVLLVRGARLRGWDEPWLLAGQGATIGVALQGLATLAGRAAGAPWLATAAALAVSVAGLGLARRAAPPPERTSVAAPAAPVLAVALLALLLQPLASVGRLGEPVPFDLLFHAGTAAELRHRWPLEDPRVAGVPLRYHVLAYALPIEAADVADEPVADALLALAPLLWVGLLAVQLASATRVLVGDAGPGAGAVAAAVALFHTDPGPLLGLGPGAFGSHLATATYGSPTTVCSFVLLCGLVVALDGWVGAGRRRDLGAVALLALAASATKTTLVPVVLGGLALATARAWRRERADERRRFAAALGAAAVASAPFTAWQSLGASTYSRMAHLGLGAAFARSGLAAAARDRLGEAAASGPGALPWFLVWLVGFLGVGGIGAALWLLGRRGRLTALQGWALLAAGVALAASQLVDAPGLSQLFLAYNGQLLLCCLAGAGIVQATALRARAARAAALALILLAALPSLAMLARAVPATLAADASSRGRALSPVERDYVRGLAWLRARAAADAVVFADNPSLLLSSFGEVRLFYENGLYTARAWEVAPGQDPYPDRAALQERLLRGADAEALEAARRAAGARPRVVVVADNVQSRIEAGFVRAAVGPVPRRRLFPEALFELRYSNAAMHVYEARRTAPAPKR